MGRKQVEPMPSSDRFRRRMLNSRTIMLGGAIYICYSSFSGLNPFQLSAKFPATISRRDLMGAEVLDSGDIDKVSLTVKSDKTVSGKADGNQGISHPPTQYMPVYVGTNTVTASNAPEEPLEVDAWSIETLCEPCRLATFAGNGRCVERIERWMQGRQGLNFTDAVRTVSGEYEACQVCHPDHCKFAKIRTLESYRRKNSRETMLRPTLQQQWANRKRISYRLEPKSHNQSSPFTDPFYPYYSCSGRPELPSSIEQAMSFVTTVSTNLKIIFMGDSVGIQIAQWFQYAVGATNLRKRHILRYSWKDKEGLALAPLVRGGGQVASWRITGMLHPRGENRPLPNKPGGGWLRSDATRLLDLSSLYDSSSSNSNNNTIGANQNTPEPFDAMVFRPPHGWLKASEITTYSFQNTVDLAHELFGVSTVVFVSMYFINNVQTMDDLMEMQQANAKLKQFANTYHKNHSNTTATTAVRHVLVLELGPLVEELVELNAQHLGYSQDFHSNFNNRIFMDDWNKSVPLVCGKPPTTSKAGDVQCDNNQFSYDGMHFCRETLGDRISAGIACLLTCVHNNQYSGKNELSVSTCAADCNAKFMSLGSVK